MDATWQSSIDRTLRSTEATLEQLSHRRDNYDRAKRRVDDYLGATPNRHDGPPALDVFDHDLSLPPPLPQHLRYRAARMAGPSPPAPTSLDPSAPARRSRLLSSAGGCADPRPPGPSSSPLQLVNAQVRGALLELELEKAKRADSVRELAHRTTAELSEMRSLITQLQTENEALKKSVRALEGRLGYGGKCDSQHKSVENSAATTADGATSISLSGAFARPTHAGMLSSSTVNNGFGPAHDATMPAGAAASLAARVEALEAGLARQQQQAEDRQTRVASVLHELVKAEVGSEVSQVRALAREAARDSAENLLKLRLSALQSSTQADLQKALHIASASETVAQHAQQQCREAEQRLYSHMHKLQAQLSEWQRTHSSDASGSAAAAALVSSQQEQERIATVDRRIAEQLRGVQRQLQEYRADVEAQVDRLAQQHKALSSVVQRKADAGELLAVREHVEEQQRDGSSEWMSRDQVTALLRAQLQPLHDEVRKTQAMAQENLGGADAWRQQAAMRLAAVEASMKAYSAETLQDQQWQSCARDIQQLRTDMSSVQSCAAEAVRQARAELADVWDAKVRLLEERTQQMHRERQQQTDAQLRQLQQTLAEQQEALQRARVAGESSDERLRRTEAALAAVEATLPRAVEGVRARCEALQGLIQQTCVLPVTRVQQDIEEAQRKLQAAEEDRIRLNSSWTQQLAEARQYHEERARHTREVLEQRLAHHKELYEELRTQQTLQRRAAEEQHQQLMDRVRQVQQQQQYGASSVVALTPVREPPAEGESTPALATAAPTTMASTSGPEEGQHSLQLLASRLQVLDNRLEAVEEACAKVPFTVADATASVAKRLEGLQNRVHAEADDGRKRHDALKRDMELQLGAVPRKCSETAASIDTQSARTARQVEELLSPLQLVTHLAANDSCLQHLARRLRDHLELAPENTAALADVRAHLVVQAKTLEVLQASVQDTQQRLTGLSEMRLADQTSAAVPSSSSEMESAAAAEAAAAREEMPNVVRSLQVALEEQRERQEDLEKGLRHVTTEQLTTITTELAELKRVTDSVPLELAKLAEQCSALQSVQRQQLPTLQKYVQDVVDVVESNQSAQMGPIQLRLRAVEDRHKHLQARVEEVSATHEADAAQKVQDLHRTLGQQQKVHKAVEEQLAGLRDNVAATRADVDSLAQRMAAAEQVREHATDLQVVASSAKANETAAAKTDEALVVPDAVAELRLYMEDIDERLAQLEEQAHSSVSVTAEMLGAFRDQLQHVVGRFAAAAAQFTGNAEGNEANEAENGDAAATEAAVAATKGVSCSTQPPIHSLEDVLLFLLHQLHQFQHALRQLQSNTVDTLEILEQHEESVAPLPMLQHTVDVMAATLLPLAERLGVDAAAVRAVSAQPQHRHHHHVSLFPPSRSSSSSGSSASEKCEWVRG
ncbi:conserved hypothetical protein [Leishmania infantum JPCM5]|uniref:Uncharacterized protein n=2 Tax=Leishmania infantum TaxID=5671 RepID=A4I087_LEIIN|nr:conserved hypothetical protein [Leishmania infantum JPCM5]CAC9489229.1 hypothetical_protein_-_conserved [Leishmania infantum]CAM68154.1 conserved hypothetical protein [Leishmania infantum JPCM5]SUZ41924.1 hypothetical_protein_-_conserved [Leishmania infantum]|eukprot:XP_001465728.1 conserved hypothetical protein [Leishmania infantum JPCM5]